MNSNRNKSASVTAVQRLNHDYLTMKKKPVPYISAEPLPSNILEWHYLVRGPEKTPYEGGYYHGKLIFPQEFPFKPPSIFMITPNGRFACNKRLCLSISDHHPDTWNPIWSVSTILTGLLSFMVGKDKTLGSIVTSDDTKKQLSAQSLAFNLQDEIFCELFPDVVDEIKQKLGVLPQPLALSSSEVPNDGKPRRAARQNHKPQPVDTDTDGELRMALDLSARAQEAEEQRRRRQEEEELERALQLSLAERPGRFLARGAHHGGAQKDEMRRREEEAMQPSQRGASGPDPELRLAMELSARAQEEDEHRRMQQENEELARILQLSLTDH